MATSCTTVVCPENCESDLPAVEFDICNPEVHFGQISDVFITNVGQPLLDENDASEWSSRLSMAVGAVDRIVNLKGIGDKPVAESTEVEISYGRKVQGNKDHTINFSIDETSDTNYNMMRSFECSKTVLVWYKTYEGKLYGGASGIRASIKFNHLIPENAAELEKLVGSITWKDKFHPCRTDYPLQGEISS